jgi:hypothetical protein
VYPSAQPGGAGDMAFGQLAAAMRTITVHAVTLRLMERKIGARSRA